MKYTHIKPVDLSQRLNNEKRKRKRSGFFPLAPILNARIREIKRKR